MMLVAVITCITGLIWLIFRLSGLLRTPVPALIKELGLDRIDKVQLCLNKVISDKITLQWSTPRTSIHRYLIWLNGDFIGLVDGSETGTSISGLVPDTKYVLEMAALSSSGLASQKSRLLVHTPTKNMTILSAGITRIRSNSNLRINNTPANMTLKDQSEIDELRYNLECSQQELRDIRAQQEQVEENFSNERQILMNERDELRKSKKAEDDNRQSTKQETKVLEESRRLNEARKAKTDALKAAKEESIERMKKDITAWTENMEKAKLRIKELAKLENDYNTESKEKAEILKADISDLQKRISQIDDSNRNLSYHRKKLEAVKTKVLEILNLIIKNTDIQSALTPVTYITQINSIENELLDHLPKDWLTSIISEIMTDNQLEDEWQTTQKAEGSHCFQANEQYNLAITEYHEIHQKYGNLYSKIKDEIGTSRDMARQTMASLGNPRHSPSSSSSHGNNLYPSFSRPRTDSLPQSFGLRHAPFHSSSQQFINSSTQSLNISPYPPSVGLRTGTAGSGYSPAQPSPNLNHQASINSLYSGISPSSQHNLLKTNSGGEIPVDMLLPSDLITEEIENIDQFSPFFHADSSNQISNSGTFHNSSVNNHGFNYTPSIISSHNGPFNPESMIPSLGVGYGRPDSITNNVSIGDTSSSNLRSSFDRDPFGDMLNNSTNLRSRENSRGGSFDDPTNTNSDIISSPDPLLSTFESTGVTNSELTPPPVRRFSTMFGFPRRGPRNHSNVNNTNVNDETNNKTNRITGSRFLFARRNNNTNHNDNNTNNERYLGDINITPSVSNHLDHLSTFNPNIIGTSDPANLNTRNRSSSYSSAYSTNSTSFAIGMQPYNPSSSSIWNHSTRGSSSLNHHGSLNGNGIENEDGNKNKNKTETETETETENENGGENRNTNGNKSRLFHSPRSFNGLYANDRVDWQYNEHVTPDNSVPASSIVGLQMPTNSNVIDEYTKIQQTAPTPQVNNHPRSYSRFLPGFSSHTSGRQDVSTIDSSPDDAETSSKTQSVGNSSKHSQVNSLQLSDYMDDDIAALQPTFPVSSESSEGRPTTGEPSDSLHISSTPKNKSRLTNQASTSSNSLFFKKSFFSFSKESKDPKHKEKEKGKDKHKKTNSVDIDTSKNTNENLKDQDDHPSVSDSEDTSDNHTNDHESEHENDTKKNSMFQKGVIKSLSLSKKGSNSKFKVRKISIFRKNGSKDEMIDEDEKAEKEVEKVEKEVGKGGEKDGEELDKHVAQKSPESDHDDEGTPKRTASTQSGKSNLTKDSRNS